MLNEAIVKKITFKMKIRNDNGEGLFGTGVYLPLI